ncbi:hypothetical protein ATO12_19575 [Aquimarina atlantica]|uniref:Lipoprotein n=1 Tax=Aquimarina atlantica TaxID=1317122 RepID=A0A023BT72_9FLAO|nr:hypothetical protein [Aquimarina atlantica]EZH73206.1 hypothetical protein ATO12_19575 [Aquimarina atlantica]
MKKTCIILSLLILASCSSQPEIPLIPEKGSIHFERVIHITNQKLVDSTYSKSLNTILENTRNSSVDIIKEIAVSTRGKNQAMQKVMDMQNMVKDAFKKTCHPNFMEKDVRNSFCFEKGLILSTCTANEKSQNYILDPENVTITQIYLDKKQNRIRSQPTKYYYFNVNDFHINEYRNQTKVIKGYKCFKVVLEINKPLPLSSKLPAIKEKYIMYVTEEIKFKYHPLVLLKEVLEQYYPLEIIETTDLVEGYQKVYTVTEMNLK